ncbi:MAG: hypothetical protein QG620_34 [Patescibacteria group bacterium]|nr:hypothetical protein [Patescibacteria group bacterium]
MEKSNKNKDYEFMLLERLESKLDTLIEGQKMMEDEHSEMKEKIEKIDLLVEDMDFVKGEIVEIRNRFREMDKELAEKADKDVTVNHETRIIRLESSALAEA